jgi:hypothetical protein
MDVRIALELAVMIVEDWDGDDRPTLAEALFEILSWADRNS